MHFYRFAPAWNDGIYTRPLPILGLLTHPNSDGADHVIIGLKFPSAGSIFQVPEEVKI